MQFLSISCLRPRSVQRVLRKVTWGQRRLRASSLTLEGSLTSTTVECPLQLPRSASASEMRSIRSRVSSEWGSSLWLRSSTSLIQTEKSTTSSTLLKISAYPCTQPRTKWPQKELSSETCLWSKLSKKASLTTKLLLTSWLEHINS